MLRNHLVLEDEVYLLAGDEVVVTKAGKRTFGLNRFFSSLYGRPVKGLCFFSLSLVSVKRRSSYSLGCWQMVRSAEAAELATGECVQDKPRKARGRPKGSKNRDKVNVEFGAHLRFVQGLLQPVLKLVRSLIGVRYLVLDGAYGYNEVMQLARGLELSFQQAQT